MDEIIDHRPPVGRGTFIHLGIMFMLLAGSGYLLWQALIAQVRGIFILYLIASIIVFLPFPFFLYRLFSLYRAKYTLSRDGVGIQWGLRTEDIPITDIEWIRLPADLAAELPLPTFFFPGALLGTKSHRDLGEIEFIASDPSRLTLIAASNKIYAISPRNTAAFQTDFYRSVELGSITPIEKQSSQPQFIITSLLADKTARLFLLASIILSLLLLVSVSFVIPTRETVPLGLEAIGVNREESASERLILLPILSLFVFFLDLGFGSFLYRKKGFRNAAYIVFASSLVLPLSFAALLVMILLS